MAACFASLAGGKSFMYLLFIRRARIANGNDLISNKQRILFNVIAPIYVTIYWLFYVTGSMLFFPGSSEDPLKNTQYISFCVWKSAFEPQQIFLIMVFSWDFINCVFFVYIFMAPLWTMMYNMQDTMDDALAAVKKQKLMHLMKWNCSLSFIATFSSIIGNPILFYLLRSLMSQGIIWGICLMDPMLNCTCAYFMMQRNRNFWYDLLCTNGRNERSHHKVARDDLNPV